MRGLVWVGIALLLSVPNGGATASQTWAKSAPCEPDLVLPCALHQHGQARVECASDCLLVAQIRVWAEDVAPGAITTSVGDDAGTIQTGCTQFGPIQVECVFSFTVAFDPTADACELVEVQTTYGRGSFVEAAEIVSTIRACSDGTVSDVLVE